MSASGAYDRLLDKFREIEAENERELTKQREHEDEKVKIEAEISSAEEKLNQLLVKKNKCLEAIQQCKHSRDAIGEKYLKSFEHLDGPRDRQNERILVDSENQDKSDTGVPVSDKPTSNSSLEPIEADGAAPSTPSRASNIRETFGLGIETGDDNEIEDLSLSDMFPTVVRLHGKWHEIACFVCGTNVTGSRDEYLRGTKALLTHLAQAHPNLKAQPGELIQKCIVRTFDDRDIVRMRKGRNPILGDVVRRLLRRDKTRSSLQPDSSAIESRKGVRRSSRLTSDNSGDLDGQPHRSDVAQSTLEKETRIQEIFPHIIYHHGQWIELSCKYCQANAGIQGTFFRGIDGFLRHINSHNKARTLDLHLDTCLEHCNITVLDPSDADKIYNGEKPSRPIVKKFPARPQWFAEGPRATHETERIQNTHDHLGIAGNNAATPIYGARSQFARDSGTLFGNMPSYPRTIHPKYPSVVTWDTVPKTLNSTPQTFYSIRCNVESCQANADSGLQFFDGVQGLQTHVESDHGKQASLRDLLSWCNVTLVPASDVALMRNGLEPRMIEIKPDPGERFRERSPTRAFNRNMGSVSLSEHDRKSKLDYLVRLVRHTADVHRAEGREVSVPADSARTGPMSGVTRSPGTRIAPRKRSIGSAEISRSKRIRSEWEGDERDTASSVQENDDHDDGADRSDESGSDHQFVIDDSDDEDSDEEYTETQSDRGDDLGSDTGLPEEAP